VVGALLAVAGPGRAGRRAAGWAGAGTVGVRLLRRPVAGLSGVTCSPGPPVPVSRDVPLTGPLHRRTVLNANVTPPAPAQIGD
jgi:hypothetical protein